jgi:hypothetical protein
MHKIANGEKWAPDPNDMSRECECLNGEVQCYLLDDPPGDGEHRSLSQIYMGVWVHVMDVKKNFQVGKHI